jgi:2-keto-3-deoxy-L-rhamnonate aldolase RhmA
MAMANHETYLIVQVEETEVIPHLETIAALPGVDVLFVGPGDLSNGMRAGGQVNGSEVMAVIRQVAEVARRHGKVAGIPCTPKQVKQYYDLGYRFFNVVSDYRCLVNGLKQTKADLAELGLVH